jgi:cytidine deaminase
MPLPNRDALITCYQIWLLDLTPGVPLLPSRREDRGMETGTIDWAGLRAAATEAARRAYAPYSRLRVGAAGQTTDGRVVTGCNVENASYGLTLCAECGLVSALHAAGPAAGGGRPALVAVSVVAADGAPLVPCGRCRQLLLEAGGPGLLVDTAAGPAELASLLPSAFDPGELAARRDDDA